MEFIIKKFTFEQFKRFYPEYVPSWMNKEIFDEAIRIAFVLDKLHACKFLVNLSDDNDTRPFYGLKWAKHDFLDLVLVKEEILTPENKIEQVERINKELLEALEFIVKVANGKSQDKTKTIELRFERDTLLTWLFSATELINRVKSDEKENNPK